MPGEIKAEDRSIRILTAEGFRKVAYRVWYREGADKGGPTVACVHGLTRNQRDFDFLARAAVERGPPGTRALTIDVPGRGDSDRLQAKALYGYPLYLSAVSSVIEHETLGAGVLYVGTSMGGLIGMMLAGMDGTPVRRMVMNDIGPFIPKEAIQRIATYVGVDHRFKDSAAAEAYMRTRYAMYGRGMSDEFWRHLTQHGVEDDGEGGLRLRYDLGISEAFADKEALAKDVDLWSFWDKVKVPVLVLRGADSDVMPADVAARMAAASHTSATLVEYPETGHTPALMSPETGIDDALRFLFDESA